MVGQLAVFTRGEPHILWIEKGEMPLIEIEHLCLVRHQMLHRKQSWGDFLDWRSRFAAV